MIQKMLYGSDVWLFGLRMLHNLVHADTIRLWCAYIILKSQEQHFELGFVIPLNENNEILFPLHDSVQPRQAILCPVLCVCVLIGANIGVKQVQN